MPSGSNSIASRRQKCRSGLLAPGHLSPEILFLDGLALVIGLLSPGKGNLELGIAVIRNIEPYRNNGEALFFTFCWR